MRLLQFSLLVCKNMAKLQKLDSSSLVRNSLLSLKVTSNGNVLRRGTLIKLRTSILGLPRTVL